MLTLLSLLGCGPQGLEARVAQLEQRVTAQDELIADLSDRLKSKREKEEEQIVGKNASLAVTEWVQGEDTLEAHEATLLVFFEEWCPHCKREVPKLQQKVDTYGEQGFGIIGVTQLTRNTPPAKMQKFLEGNGVKFAIAKDDGTMSKHYGVSGVPAAAMVKDGKVVWRGHPANLNDAMIGATLR